MKLITWFVIVGFPVLGLGLSVQKYGGTSTVEAAPSAACHCAAFTDEEGMGEPIISKTFSGIGVYKIVCNEEGKNDCKEMCVNLAVLSKERAITLLCMKLLGTVNSLKPAVFYKICGNPTWTYANYTATEPICCKDHEAVTCESETYADQLA